MKNAINWFEIPSADFERATAFYNTILDAELRVQVVDGISNAIFPYSGHADNAIGGTVVHNPSTKPGADGAVVYLNVDGVLDAVLSRVEAAGGKVVMPRLNTQFGAIAMILDSEGNRVGLHSY